MLHVLFWFSKLVKRHLKWLVFFRLPRATVDWQTLSPTPYVKTDAADNSLTSQYDNRNIRFAVQAPFTNIQPCKEQID